MATAAHAASVGQKCSPLAMVQPSSTKLHSIPKASGAASPPKHQSMVSVPPVSDE